MLAHLGAQPGSAFGVAGVAADAINASAGEEPAAGARRSWLEPLDDLWNMQYIGKARLGTPARHVRLLVDTGSADIPILPPQDGFNRSSSSTANFSNLTVDISYGQGNVIGLLGSDVFSMSGLTVEFQNFVYVTEASGMSNVGADGILGLALPGLSHSGETFLQHLYRHNIVMFWLVLGDYASSYLGFGAPPPSVYDASRLVWAPVVYDMWWAFRAEFRISKLHSKNVVFMIDSGTSYLGVPAQFFMYVVTAILPKRALESCSLQASYNLFTCPCEHADVAHSFDLLVGRHRFSIPARELFLQTSASQCVLEVMQLPPGLPFILGDTFLRTVTVVFDMAGMRIGIAERPGTPSPAPGPFPPISVLPPWLPVFCMVLSLCIAVSVYVYVERVWRPAPSAADAQTSYVQF